LETSLILAYEVIVEDSQGKTKLKNIIELEVPLLHFLLEDLELKMKFILATRKRPVSFLSNATSQQRHQAIALLHPFLCCYSSMEALKLLSPVFPALCCHLERVSEKLVDEENNDFEEAPYLIPCMLIIFETFQKLCLYDELHSNQENRKIFMRILRQVIHTREIENDDKNLTEEPSQILQTLQNEAFDYFHSYEKTMFFDIRIAIALFDLLFSIHHSTLRPIEYSSKLSEQAGKLLKKHDWNEDCLKPEWIVHLLRHHIQLSVNPMKIVGHLTVEIFPRYLHSIEGNGKKQTIPYTESNRSYEEQGEEEEENNEEKTDQIEYGTLNKHTMPSYYKVLMTEVVTAFANTIQKQMNPERLNLALAIEEEMDGAQSENFGQFLLGLEEIVKVFQCLIELTKIKAHRVMLSISLKQGKSFVDLFLSTISLLATHFLEYKDHIRAILRTLQSSTRILQNLCAHAKVQKDRSLTNIVPSLRKVLETLIFKVKGLLQANNVLNAFGVGSLKHRNLQGEVVSSQLPPDEDDKEEEEEEEEFINSNHENNNNEQEDLGAVNYKEIQQGLENMQKDSSDEEVADETSIVQEFGESEKESSNDDQMGQLEEMNEKHLKRKQPNRTQNKLEGKENHRKKPQRKKKEIIEKQKMDRNSGKKTKKITNNSRKRFGLISNRESEEYSEPMDIEELHNNEAVLDDDTLITGVNDIDDEEETLCSQEF